MKITDDQIELLKNQGFVIIKSFLSEDERKNALDGFFRFFAPPYHEWEESGEKNTTPQQGSFPWDHSGLNHAIAHPDLIDAAERILGTRGIRLCEAHLGMKYYRQGELSGTDPDDFHVDYGNNTLGPMIEPDDFKHIAIFYCFDEVKLGMAPIKMVANGRPTSEAVPMIVPAGSICIYTPFTVHAASQFSLPGHRPVAWVGFSCNDRPWDGGRSFTYKSGASYEGMKRFIVEASPRQLELIGFPPPGDGLWTNQFIEGMQNRYTGFNPQPYRKAQPIHISKGGSQMSPKLKISHIDEALAELGVGSSLLTAAEKQALDEQGYIVFPNLIDPEWLLRLQDAYEQLMAKEGQNAGKEVVQEKGTRRLADLMNKGEVFDGCYTHPKVLAAIYHIIGGEFKVSAMNGRDALPGEGHQEYHADWGLSRLADEPYYVAISLWMLDEFTTLNGATRVVPGSHKLSGKVSDYMPNPADPHPNEILLTGPAGSVAVLNSHLWHGGTLNCTGKTRRALHPYYNARGHEQQQNQREFIRKSTYDRITPAARYLLDVD